MLSEDEHGVAVFTGWTNKFIFPPYDFTVASAMVSGFHMPYSTMLMMVAAFGGYDLVMHAYEEGIIECHEQREITFTFPYMVMNDVMRAVKDPEIKILSQIFLYQT